jgi:hypothetical protein
MTLVNPARSPPLDTAGCNFGELFIEELFERPANAIDLGTATTASRLHPRLVLLVQELGQRKSTLGSSPGDLDAKRRLCASLLRFFPRIGE